MAVSWTQSVNRTQQDFLYHMVNIEKVAVSEADYIRFLIDAEIARQKEQSE